jgi:acyl carrier protein
VTRARVLELMQRILDVRGKDPSQVREEAGLRDISFRSLDFSELCLRVEEEIGHELNFEAAALRRIESVADVCDFLESAAAE